MLMPSVLGRETARTQVGRLVLWAGVTILGAGLHARPALAQTPSPLQEWQYSGGVILARLFQPDLPKFRTIVGLGAEAKPIYNGAAAYRVEGGPYSMSSIETWHSSLPVTASATTCFVAIIISSGSPMAYDFGRKVSDDYTNLHGMGDISAAPVARVFGSVVLSRKFPLIFRGDIRQFIGGAQGAVTDLSVYSPLPGSSKTFVMFAGPSITLATRHYLQTEFGVTPQQAIASGHPVYNETQAGTAKVGVGFSATKFLTPHWLLNLDTAISQIRGSASHSPLIERRTQRVLALSFGYQW